MPPVSEVCASSQGVRRGMARAHELLARQRMSEDERSGIRPFHILTESIRLGATALEAVDDSFWVNHRWVRAQREKEGRSRSGRE